MLRLASILLLLILVVSKIQGIVPTAQPSFWLALSVLFLLVVVSASWLSTRICYWTGISEERAEWIAVVILAFVVVSLGYLNRRVFWYFLQ